MTTDTTRQPLPRRPKPGTHTRAITTAAGVLKAAMEQGTHDPAGLASALDSARLLNSPEHTAEVEQLRAERAEAADTVAQLVQELVHRVKVEHAFRDEVERLRAHASELEKQRERRRARLVALQNDALSIRGSLAPADDDRKVPFELGETLTPAVDWLINRVAELDARLAEYERPVDEDPIAYALTEQAEETER